CKRRIELHRMDELNDGGVDIRGAEAFELETTVEDAAEYFQVRRLDELTLSDARLGGGLRVDPLHRRDKSVPTPGDRLEVLRRRRGIAKRAAKVRHELRQRVIRDRHIRPQITEQIVPRDEARRPCRQIRQQVEL